MNYMKLLKIVKSDNCKRKIEELSHFRLLLFTISFSFLIPFGFVFIYYLSTLYINFHSSDFFKTVLVLPIIIFVILYLPSVIVFLVLNLLNRIKINKKIELFFYLITGAVFGGLAAGRCWYIRNVCRRVPHGPRLPVRSLPDRKSVV